MYVYGYSQNNLGYRLKQELALVAYKNHKRHLALGIFFVKKKGLESTLQGRILDLEKFHFLTQPLSKIIKRL